MLALIGTQRSCLQDNWVQAKRKGKRGRRRERKAKAGLTGGLESRQERGGLGRGGQGRVE